MHILSESTSQNITSRQLEVVSPPSG